MSRIITVVYISFTEFSSKPLYLNTICCYCPLILRGNSETSKNCDPYP